MKAKTDKFKQWLNSRIKDIERYRLTCIDLGRFSESDLWRNKKEAYEEVLNEYDKCMKREKKENKIKEIKE